MAGKHITVEKYDQSLCITGAYKTAWKTSIGSCSLSFLLSCYVYDTKLSYPTLYFTCGCFSWNTWEFQTFWAFLWNKHKPSSNGCLPFVRINWLGWPLNNFCYRCEDHSLRTQTYFWLSLVSAENNVCKPEPGNDFCDVGILSQSQSSSSSPRTTARGIHCGEHLSFYHGIWLAKEKQKSQKSFPGSGSQT